MIPTCRSSSTSSCRPPCASIPISSSKEALTNALKYSQPGSPISIGLRYGPHLELTVTSEGAAATTSRAGQVLRRMRRRATLLRAGLRAGAVPGGWQVSLKVPH